MERLATWVSAGLLSAGVSAAVLAGAGVATADDSTSSSGSESGASESTTSTQTDGPAGPTSGTAPDSSAEAEPEAAAPDEPADDPVSETPKKKKRNLTARTDAMTALKPRSGPVSASAPERAVPVAADTALPALTVATPAVTDIGGGGAAAVARIAAQPGASLALAAPPAPAPVQAAAASPPNLIRWLQGVVGRVTNGIGSLAFNSLQALEALLTGPPVLPPNSTVTVRNSTILLSTGQRVRANWYYPEGEEVPEKLIVLQHGFFALGPMYSFTAANLAESTGAIVVTPTISSNPFGGDDNWINGSGMAAAIADLFVGDRQALTDSALAAGFATRYGLDPAQAQLPEKFGLAGHSAGAGLVSAVAGYLVDKGAADDLVGVILDHLIQFPGDLLLPGPVGDQLVIRRRQDGDDVAGAVAAVDLVADQRCLHRFAGHIVITTLGDVGPQTGPVNAATKAQCNHDPDHYVSELVHRSTPPGEHVSSLFVLVDLIHCARTCHLTCSDARGQQRGQRPERLQPRTLLGQRIKADSR